MSVINTPWDRLGRPQSAILSTLAVSSDSNNNWFWVKNALGEYGLGFRVSKTDRCKLKDTDLSATKRLKEVKVEDKGSIYIGVVISESELATVFYRLCLDLIDSCYGLKEPNEIVGILKRRVRSWQRLFESGVRRLSLQQCLGLIAELAFLRDCWLNRSDGNGVLGWLGPLDRPQDFLCENEGLAVEVKAYSPEARTIRISSIHQLESPQSLYLACYPCSLSTEMEGKSISEFIQSVYDKLSERDCPILDDLLLAYGYVHDPYYESLSFVVGEPSFYSVHSTFPRITPTTVSPAITQAKYMIDLEQISGFQCDPSSF